MAPSTSISTAACTPPPVQSVEQIHAPQAWAAGFDGSGAKVAVLDTGYDPTHPDLAGRVSSSSNFTTDPGVVDGNGHGTHVASTIAGSGAASGGFYEGVAPGASLMVGKVLGNDGMGDDSWVLAGMQWAVANGADVVNMSLGGDPGDGTDPLSQASTSLSAKSKHPVRRRRRQRRQRPRNRHGPRSCRRRADRRRRRHIDSMASSPAVARVSVTGP